MPVLPIRGRALGVDRRGRALLDGIDVEIAGKGLTVLMGPNGAGKSLLLRILSGLVKPDRGTILWDRTPPNRQRASRIGFVLQKPVMLRRSALDNVRYALKAAGVPRRERDALALAALDRAALGHLAGAPARVLSGGEQQRLSIARALATAPDVLFLDEPTANLDPAATVAIEDMMREARAQGTKVVLVTHDVGQARRLADEVVFMHQGRIDEAGPAGRFFDQPQSQAAQAFLKGQIVL
jgi:tungstate transport system ATP-binding protein